MPTPICGSMPTTVLPLLHGLRPLGPAGHGAASSSSMRSTPAGRSTSTTTARCGATSPISTISSKAIVRLIDVRAGSRRTEAAADEPALVARGAVSRRQHRRRRAGAACSISSKRSRRKLGKPAIRNYLPMQKGDVPVTFADCHLLERLTGYRPRQGSARGRCTRRLV